ncbi:hypothetical protein, partial [Bifidobacterium aquikefiri]|uniref:hypothetical protein n=1 Tax=Bifidobacterium aquikefiri TaxID=1653207 RepID=UPI0039E9C4D0
YHRLAALARDDDGVVVHTTDSHRSLGMTGEEHGIDWNELHADTPAKTKNPHFYAYNPETTWPA